MKESVSAIRGRRNDVLRRLASVFMIAVPVNYLWELGQSPLYLPPSRLGDMLWHCFVASLGDGVIIGLIYAACAILFRDRNWFGRMSVAHWGALLTVNLAVGTLVVRRRDAARTRCGGRARAHSADACAATAGLLGLQDASLAPSPPPPLIDSDAAAPTAPQRSIHS
jgi:hypothetical protein